MANFELMLPASGLMLVVLECKSQKCKRKTTTMLADRDILAHYRNGISSMSSLAKADSKPMGKLQLGSVGLQNEQTILALKRVADQ